MRHFSGKKEPTAKQTARDPLFDVARGIGILCVFGIHSANNSSRLFTNLHSPQWWLLFTINRFCNFAVPLFLLISAILSARSLCTNPSLAQFYRRRLPGVLWPYLVWTFVYWCFRIVQEPASRKMQLAHLFGVPLRMPALFLHVKMRLGEVLWGKAAFHLYFMVVLLEMLILLPAAVAYLRWRKPGLYETLITAFALQMAILVGQHLTALLPFPASTALWYVGSMMAGAWIGINWESFKVDYNRYTVPLALVSAVAFGFFLKGEIGQAVQIPADNYVQNFSLAVYSVCPSILILGMCFTIVKLPKLTAPLLFLGVISLQIYLIHPAVMVGIEKFGIARVLNATTIGPLLSPLLLLAITFGIIWVLRLLRIEKLMFGR